MCGMNKGGEIVAYVCVCVWVGGWGGGGQEGERGEKGGRSVSDIHEMSGDSPGYG